MADTQTTSVPVKIDASALAEVINRAAKEAPVEYIEPAPFISNAGTRMGELYARYLLLNRIAAEINGKKLSDPIPASLKLEKVTFTFSTDKATEKTTVDVFNIACVGDISPLLSTELGAIIYSIEQEAKSVVEIASKTNETCSKARTEWEAANPDRKIVQSSLVNSSGVPMLGAPSEPQIVVEPTKQVPLNDEN